MLGSRPHLQYYWGGGGAIQAQKLAINHLVFSSVCLTLLQSLYLKNCSTQFECVYYVNCPTH